MSEELIEISCTRCGRTILVKSRWDSCPMDDCLVKMAGYDDDVLDIALDGVTEDLKSITDRMVLLGRRICERDDNVRN